MAKPAVDLAVLTETAIRILDYDNGVFRKEDLFTFRPEKNMGMGLYLPLKALHGHPDVQQDLLARLANGVKGRDGYTKSERILRDYFFEPLVSSRHEVGAALKHEFQSLEADGRSLGRMMFYGPQTIEEKSLSIAKSVYRRGSIPVLKAYSALVSLKPFLDLMFADREIDILMPDYLKDGNSDLMGYRIVKDGKNLKVDKIRKSGGVSKESLVVVRFTSRNIENDDLVDFLKKNGAGKVSAISITDGIFVN